MKSNPEIFTFGQLKDGLVDVRDFQTTGVVAFAKGTPLYGLKPGKRDVMGQRVQVNASNQENCMEAHERPGGQALSDTICPRHTGPVAFVPP